MKESVFGRTSLIFVFLFAFAVVFLAPNSFAADEFIREQWFFNGDSFIANNKAFIMHMDDNSIIYISSDGESAGIPYASCSRLNSTKICYNMSVFDVDQRAMKAKLLIFSVAPKITVTRQISKSFVYVDEEAVVSVSVSNTGGTAATVDYFDEFPDSVQLLYASGCVISNNTIRWSGMVGKDSADTFSFTIKPKDELYRTIKASAVYYDGQDIKTAYSNAITLDARQFLVLSTSVSDTSLLNGQIVNLTLNLSSRYSKKLNNQLASYVEVVLPESMVFYDASDIIKKINNYVYNWSLTLYQNNTAQIVLLLRAKRTGTSEVVLKTSYETDSGNFSLSGRKVPFTVTGKDLLLSSEIKKGVSLQTELESGEEYNLIVYIQNPNQYIAFTSVNMTLFTNLTYVENVIIPYFNASSQRIPVNVYFTAPLVDSTKSFPFYININYTTEFGDYSYATLRKSVSVRAPETPAISYALTPSSNVESKDEFTLKVQVRNPRKIDISNVRITTKIPDAFKVKGVTDLATNINKVSTLDAYEVKITAPATALDKTYIFNTTVSYTDEATGKEIFTYKEHEMKIAPKKIMLSYTRSVSDSKIFRNKIILLDHILSSNDNDGFRNLVILFPVQKYIDVVDSLNYSVNKISPGETITLTGIENIRVKEKDSISVEPVTLKYQDMDGYRLNATFGAISLSLASGYSEDTGPSLIADKKISLSKVNRSIAQNATIVITLRNIGDEMAKQIYLSDEYEQMIIADLAPGMQTEIRYDISGDDINSTGQIKRSILSYVSQNKGYKYTTASEDLFVPVIAAKPIVLENLSSVEVQVLPTEIVVVSNETGQAQPAEEQLKKGFFANLWDSIKKVLFWKRKQ